MKECSFCKESSAMPYECNRCGENFCSSHRLPEKHDCPMLEKRGNKQKLQVEFEDKKQNNSYKQSLIGVIKSPLDRLYDWFGVRVTPAIAMVLLLVYISQILVVSTLGFETHNSIFVLSGENIEYVWTWVTSIFSHSPNTIYHIIGNLVILAFFGTLLEKKIGEKSFAYLFLSSGLVAGLFQVLAAYLLGSGTTGVLGASGALLAIMGTLTVYSPKMKVYLYFVVPVPLWIISIAYALVSISGLALSGGIFPNLAHGAHIAGLVFGLLYGYKTRDSVSMGSSKRLSEIIR